MCNRGVMEFPHLLWRAAFESHGAAVADSRWLVIYRFADAEGATVVPVEKPGVAAVCTVTHRLARPERPEHRIIEALRPLDVVGSDHDMVKHASLPFSADPVSYTKRDLIGAAVSSNGEQPFSGNLPVRTQLV